MLQSTDATPAARPNPSSKKDMKALTMKFVPPDTSLKDYKTRRSGGGDRINAEREHSRQGVPALDRRKLTPWRQ